MNKDDYSFVAYENGVMVLAVSLRRPDKLKEFFREVNRDGLDFELVTNEKVRELFHKQIEEKPAE